MESNRARESACSFDSYIPSRGHPWCDACFVIIAIDDEVWFFVGDIQEVVETGPASV